MKKKTTGDHPPTDIGVTSGRRLGWIRSKDYKIADDVTLYKILNPPPPPTPEFQPDEYITGTVDDSRLLYKCHEPNCGALFTFDISLRLHSKKHLNPNLKCTFCGRLSKTEDELSQHCKEFHPDLQKDPDGDPLKCRKCNKVSRDSTALWRHIRESHRAQDYPCPHCNFPFTRPENLKTHIKSKHFSQLGEKKPPKFPCKICEKVFSYRNSLMGHIRNEHRGKPAKRFECKICGSTYSCKNSYNFHMRQHINSVIYPCNICYIRFRTQAKLNRHNKCLNHLKNARQAKRKGSVPYFTQMPIIKTVKTINQNLTNEQMVDLCKKTMVKIVLHRVDEFNVRPPPPPTSSSEDDDEDDSENSPSNSAYLNCIYCDKTLPNLDAVKSHEPSCSMNIRNKKLIVCAICDKEFDKPYKLMLHARKHKNERPFTCSHCNATFKSGNAKRLHEKNLHFGIRKPIKKKMYKCDFEGCGREFKCITSLKTHRDTIHLGVRYPCEECGKVFRRDDILKKHLKNWHSKCSLRLECKHCNRTYGNKTTYLAHLLKPRHLRKVKQFEKQLKKENCTLKSPDEM